MPPRGPITGTEFLIFTYIWGNFLFEGRSPILDWWLYIGNNYIVILIVNSLRSCKADLKKSFCGSRGNVLQQSYHANPWACLLLSQVCVFYGFHKNYFDGIESESGCFYINFSLVVKGTGQIMGKRNIKVELCVFKRLTILIAKLISRQYLFSAKRRCNYYFNNSC